MNRSCEMIALNDVCEKTSNIKWNKDDKKKFSYIDLSSVSRDVLEITGSIEIDGKSAPSRAKKIIKTDDVIFATTRPTLKRVAIVPEVYNEQICSTGFTVLRNIKDKIIHNYIFYFLQSDKFMKRVESLQRGASYPAISDTDVKQSILRVPSLEEQKQIVAILDQAFAAIDQAQANIKQNIQYAKDLFQSKLNQIFSQQGVGWEERSLGDESLVKMIDGDRGKNYPKKADFRSEGHCVFMNTGNVRANGFDFENVMFISEKRDNLLRKGKLQRDDVVMTTRGTIGNLGWYNSEVKYDHIRINSGMLIFRVNKEEILPEYLFSLFRSPVVTKQITDMTSGAAQPQLPIKTLVKFKIPVNPDLSEQKKMVVKIQQMELMQEKLLSTYKSKIKNLEELKKSLLQKAFYGELTQNKRAA